ncbi:MAG: arginase family protein [Fusobacteria bacterium]|nr:arginase family protein [Fusobacteriota bacterium]
MQDIDELGIVQVIKEIVKKLEEECDGIYLSFDIDSCDGSLFPGSGTPETGGLTAREACYITQAVASSPKFLGMDLVELNIGLDPQGTTTELALRIIDSALGCRIGGRFE